MTTPPDDPRADEGLGLFEQHGADLIEAREVAIAVAGCDGTVAADRVRRGELDHWPVVCGCLFGILRGRALAAARSHGGM